MSLPRNPTAQRACFGMITICSTEHHLHLILDRALAPTVLEPWQNGGINLVKAYLEQPQIVNGTLNIAKQVSSFKHKIPPNVAKSTQRSRVTQFIANKTSRQTFEPLIGNLCDKEVVEPLYLKIMECNIYSQSF